MLLTIHNLPIHTQYSDVKDLIISKCGLKDAIVDNLQNEGNGMRVTVGVLEDEDAALLVRKINGLFYGGQQLYVENKRQKKDSEQPYRVNVAQPQLVQQQQPSYDYSQVQVMGMWPTAQMNYMYPAQPMAQAVQGAYMAYGQQQYAETVMSQCTGTPDEFGKRQDQKNYGQQDHSVSQSETLFARRTQSPPRGWNESRWDEKYPKRDDRRRLESPIRPDLDRESQPDPKRPRWDSRDDRPDRSDRQDRFREERHSSNSYNDRFDERPRNSNQNRWDQTRGNQRPEHHNRRESPPRYKGDESESNWNTRKPQPDEFRQDFSMPDRSSPKYKKFDQGSSIAGQRSATYNKFGEASCMVDQVSAKYKFDQGSTIAAQDPGKYNKFGQGSSIAGQATVNYNKFGQASSMTGQGSTKYNKFNQDSPMPGRNSKFDQVSSMPSQGPTQYNKINQDSHMPGRSPTNYNKVMQGSPMPDQGSAKINQYKGSTVADQHKTKYNIFTHGSTQANHGSTKFNKVKAKEIVMTQIVTNANAKNILMGPSVFKNLLKKICTARVDDIVGTEELSFEDIVDRYRLKYPEVDDLALYNDIQKKISGGATMTFAESWEYAIRFVGSGRRPQNFPPQQPAADRTPSRVVKEPPAPRPIGPFASISKYETCVGKLSSHVVADILRNLDKDSEFQENTRFRTLLKKAVHARVSDIVLKMTAAPAHILPHYRKRYPYKFDSELYTKIMDTLAGKVNLNSQIIKEFADSCVVPGRLKWDERRAAIMQAARDGGEGPVQAARDGGKGPVQAARDGGKGPVQAAKDGGTGPVQAVRDGGKGPVQAARDGGKGPVQATSAGRSGPAQFKSGGGKGPAPVSTHKIPNYVQGDKKLHKEIKKDHKEKLKYLHRFEMNATFEKALDDEVEAMITLMKNIMRNTTNEGEKAVYNDINKGVMITELKKFLAHHVSKRLTNGGPKLVRIYGYPRPPKRAELENFLYKSHTNCLFVKKSVKDSYFTASFDSFDTVDYLCSLPLVNICNDLCVKFRPMHIVPKTNFTQRNSKSLRKKFIESLIDNSEVNLLDKNWPAQAEAEKRARSENMKRYERLDELEENDDVIFVENETDFTVDITDDFNFTPVSKGDNNKTNKDNDKSIENKDNDEVKENKDNNKAKENENNDKAKENKDGSNVEHEFLNEDFKVIDEVRESDNDDGPKEEANDDNEIGDDWDQTGDDWGDETGGDDENEGEDDGNMGAESTTVGDANKADANVTGVIENATEGNETDDEIDKEIGENVEGINIADVDWDDVDENDLEDY